MTVPAPSPTEISNFEFKLQCRLKVFGNEENNGFKKPCSLVATASRFGLVFVGTPANNFQVIQLQDIENFEKEVSVYPRRIIELPSNPTHLSINCDCTKLSVVVEKFGSPTAIFYDVLSFLKQQVVVIKEIRLSATPNINVIDTDWNPALPEIFTACKSDGSLGVYEFKGPALDIHELPPAAGVTCFCWSPRGKQIAVGSRDGRITQYKPDLKAVKAVNAPPLEGSPPIISLKWASSFQFIGVYKSADPNALAFLIVIDAPKSGNPMYTNYEDICYSYGATRPSQFYMILEQHWNVLMVISSNSMEVGVLAGETDKWIQWLLGDAGRAELPLSEYKQDTLPVGVSLNTGTTKPLGSGDKQYPLAPLLFLLSHHGVLCCFYALNSKVGAPSVCSPPEPVADKSGLNLFIRETPKHDSHTSPTITIPLPPQQVLLPQPPVINIPQPTQPTALSQPPVVPISVPPPSFLLPKPTQPSVPTPNNQSSLFGMPTSKPNSPLFSNLLGNQQPVTSNIGMKPVQFAATAPKVETVGTNKTVTFAPQVEEPITTTSSSTTSGSEIANNEVTPQKKVDARIPIHKETEAMIAKLIREECITLESELHMILQKGRELKVNIGTDNEVAHMAQQTNNFEEFVNALRETSGGQAIEVHTLKQNVIQTWGWYEEARSRFNSSKDPILSTLLQAKPLDPSSQGQLDEVDRLTYYLDSQILQANNSLDEQWENFQDSLTKNTKIQITTMQAICQSMMKQNEILQKQKYVLKDLSSRIKTYKRNKNSKMLISLDKVGDLEEELLKLQLHPDGMSGVENNRVFERQKKCTAEKAQKLFKYLSKKNVANISVSKPDLNNSTAHLTSLLAAPLSPIVAEKKVQPIKLDFKNYTPTAQQAEKTAKLNKPVEAIKTFGITSTPIVPIGKTKLENIDPKPVTVRNPNAVSTPLLQTPVSASAGSVKFDPPKSAFNPPSHFLPFNFTSTAAPIPNLSITTTSINTQQITTKSLVASTAPSTIPSQQSSPFAVTNKSGSIFRGNVTPPVTPTTSQIKTNVIFGNVSSSSTSGGKVADGSKITPKTSFSFISASEPDSVSSKSSVTNSTLFAALSSAGLTIVTTAASSTSTASSSIFDNAKSSATSLGTSPSFSFGSATSVANMFASAKSTTSAPPAFAPNSQSPPIFASTPIKPIATTTMPTFFSGALANTTSSTIIKPTTVVASLPSSIVTTIVSSATTVVAPAVAKTMTTATCVVLTMPSFTPTSSPLNLTTSMSAGLPTAAVTTAPLLFGNGALTITTTSINSATLVSTAAVSTPNSILITPIFGAPTTPISTVLSPTATVTASVFTAPTTTPVSAPLFEVKPPVTSSIFGGAIPTSTTEPIFNIADAKTTSSPFAAAASQGSLFGTPDVTSTGSIFSGGTSVFATTPTTATQPSVFASAPNVQGSIFGGTPNVSNTTTESSVFGGSTNSSVPTQGSIFGGTSNPSTSTPGSVFGGSANTAFGSKPTTSPFGSPPVETTAQSPIFGGNNQTAFTTTTASIFGTGVFGNTVTAATPTFGSTSPFVSSASTQSPFGGAFSSPAPAGGGSMFQQPVTFSGGSIFGGTPSTTTAGNVFGGTPTSSFGSNANTAAFGTATTAATSPFGGGPVFGATATSTSPFGTTSTANLPFAQTPQFATSGAFASKPASFGAFGSESTTSFGFNSLNVGATTTTSGNFGSFGQNTQNPFGRSTAEEQKPAFGGGSLFGTSTTTSATSVFGGSSPFNKPAAPAFGTSPAFTLPPAFGAQPSNFGQSTAFGNSFGSPGQGTFTGGAHAVQQSGFGASSAFQKAPAAFGSPAVFGSQSPSFGTPASFGGAATFGGNSSFGSPQKVFGATTTESSFGSVPQNPTFGNLATQNTLGFGNLAQQAGSPTQQQPSGFSGGSSFSSWR